jgi:GMP synthase-like glutamine amidotransferase
MKRVLFIQNGEYDAPGLFATVLRDRGVALDIVNAGCGEPTPSNMEPWAGLAVGGGGMSVYEAECHPFLRDGEALIRAARASGKPVLGMCLGAQLMASALGGKVFPNRAKEIGFHDVRFTPAAEQDALWKGHTRTFQPVQWHGDTFSLPNGAVLLASSDLTENQLFRVDEASYGFQFHLEIDEAVLASMVETDDGWLPRHGMDPQRFLREARLALPKVKPIAHTVFGRWVEGLR